MSLEVQAQSRGPSHAAANGCAMPAKQKGKRPNVSFSDELEEDSEDPPQFYRWQSQPKRGAVLFIPLTLPRSYLLRGGSPILTAQSIGVLQCHAVPLPIVCIGDVICCAYNCARRCNNNLWRSRFAKERPLETGPIAEAAPLPLDPGPFAAAVPSLGQLCFGASQARGAQAHPQCRASSHHLAMHPLTQHNEDWDDRSKTVA